jgi:hypothetical protein
MPHSPVTQEEYGMALNSKVTSLVAIAFLTSVAYPSNAADVARSYLASSMAAMGSEEKLAGITAIEYRAVGTRMMVEQSERPTGPYFIDHFQLHEIRDLQRERARIEQSHEAYAADKWWLQQTDPSTSTTVLNDDVTANLSEGKYAFGGGFLVQQNQEQFAFAPERVLQTAAAASDLRALPDVVLHGVRDHVLAFTWKGAPCLLNTNAWTNLPWSVTWTRAYPYQTFLNAWGDVTSSVLYNSWTLDVKFFAHGRPNGQPASSLLIPIYWKNPDSTGFFSFCEGSEPSIV